METLRSLYHKKSKSGLYMRKQLKRENIYLTPFSKMRVDLAAQVTTYLVTGNSIYLLLENYYTYYYHSIGS